MSVSRRNQRLSGIFMRTMYIYMCMFGVFLYLFMFCFIAGNGYIEDKELDGFLIELVTSVNAVDLGPEVRNVLSYSFRGGGAVEDFIKITSP